MKAATSARAGGAITPGEATTIAAELAMPDLDQIKQVEQGVRDWRGRFARVRSGNPTFARAIETSYFEQRLQHIEDDYSNQPDTVTGKYSAGAG